MRFEKCYINKGENLLNFKVKPWKWSLLEYLYGNLMIRKITKKKETSKKKVEMIISLKSTFI